MVFSVRSVISVVNAFQDLTQRSQRTQRGITESRGLLVRRAGDLQHSEERFLRDVHAAHALHALFSFFLFFQELAFSSDVTAVALGEDVLADRRDSFAGDYAAADGGLNRNLKHLARNQLAQARNQFPPALVGELAV